MLRSCVSRSRLHGATILPICAQSASTAPALLLPVPARAIHSSHVRLEKRQPDGNWVSDSTRQIDRPSHFNPLEPPPIVKRPPREVYPDKRPHDKISPRVNPVGGTHTISRMRHDIRMQFQLEPATRTLARGDNTRGNTKINDYTRAEVFTRAPWPSYREIIINQPHRHHVLSPTVIQQLTHFTQSVERNRDISATMVLSRHLQMTNPKAFVPGVDKTSGEARMPYEKTFSGGMDYFTLFKLAKEQKGQTSFPERQTPLAKYFRSLYTYTFDLNNVRSPILMALDGRAVGAGAGFALQSRYRIGTENTRISFPQAAIGWFPDAGASYTLPRLDGKLGLFLALTGWQVRGFDNVRLGFCTHYCESDELHRFGRRIGDSSLTYQFAEDTIEQAVGMFSDNSPSFLPMPIHDLHDVINEVFDAESVEAIIVNIVALKAKLQSKAEKASAKELATAAFLEEMHRRMMASSPLGLKVTFELLRLTQFLPLEKCLKLEFRLSQGLLTGLSNPLTAEIFNAGNFSVKTLAQVTPEMMDKLFHENADDDKELNLAYPGKPEPQWYI